MKRIWQIQEQTYVDNGTGLGFTFTSEPTELDDSVVKLVVDGGHGRKLVMEFDRNGLVRRSDVVADQPSGGPTEGMPTAAEQARAEDHSYQDVQPKPLIATNRAHDEQSDNGLAPPLQM